MSEKQTDMPQEDPQSGDDEPQSTGEGKELRDLKSKKKLKSLIEKTNKRGIVYISRLPPHMVRVLAMHVSLLRNKGLHRIERQTIYFFVSIEATKVETFVGRIWRDWKGLPCS